MKKFLALILAVLLVLSVAACSSDQDDNSEKQNSNNQENTVVDNGDSEKEDSGQKQETEEDNNKENQVEEAEFTYTVSEIDGGKTYTFSRMLTSADDLSKLDISDEYLSACAVIFTLAEYENDPDVCKEMLEYINGPEDVSDYDISFLKNQFDQYPYVMRSYFAGTSPENNYTIDGEISLTIKENTYSRDEDGYVKLLFHSSGADSDRSLTLRHKESTDEWFLFSDTYKGLTAGIRTPSSDDKWN